MHLRGSFIPHRTHDIGDVLIGGDPCDGIEIRGGRIHKPQDVDRGIDARTIFIARNRYQRPSSEGGRTEDDEISIGTGIARSALALALVPNIARGYCDG